MHTYALLRDIIYISRFFQLCKEDISKWIAYGERDCAIFQRTLEHTAAHMLQCVESIADRTDCRNYFGGWLQHKAVSQRETRSIRCRAFAQSENCTIANTFRFNRCSIGRRKSSARWRPYLPWLAHRSQHELVATVAGYVNIAHCELHHPPSDFNNIFCFNRANRWEL